MNHKTDLFLIVFSILCVIALWMGGGSNAELMPTVPGVVYSPTSTNVSGTLCNKEWSTSSIRPSTSYTGPLKLKKLADYNKQFAKSYTLAEGELDHVISIELGGDPTNPDNLDFEPYNTMVDGKQMGAHQKDAVENLLHREVCAGTISLSTAQDDVVNHWMDVYNNQIANKVGSVVPLTDPDDN